MASTTVAAGHAQPAQPAQSTAASTSRFAALRADRYRTMQLALFATGAVLMPFGILAIGLGWYGTAHAHYDYDQRTYLISGGIMGLGLTFLGGFLYFGAWLAKLAADQREATRQLAEALSALSGAVRAPVPNGATYDTEVVPNVDSLVFAGDGTTLHRRDCPLIAHRDDLHEVDHIPADATPCRVCRPVG
jgi:hypothetical protein